MVRNAAEFQCCYAPAARAQVLEELLKGTSYGKLALKLGLTKSTIGSHARIIIAQHRVKDVWELR